MKKWYGWYWIVIIALLVNTVYLILRKDNQYAVYAGYISFFGEAGFDLLGVVLSLLGWKSSGYDAKSLYCPLFFGMTSALVSDAVYTLGLNVLHLPYAGIMFSSVFETAFLIFLVSQCIFWSEVLYINKGAHLSVRHKLCSIAPFVCLSVIVLGAFLFGISWKIDHLTEIGWFQGVDTIIESIGFALVSVCLARSHSRVIFSLGIGFLMILSSDFMIRYHVVMGMVPYMSFFEVTWILGLMMISLGLLMAKNKNAFILEQVNSLKSQISAWMSTLLLALFGFGTFSYIWFFGFRLSGLGDVIGSSLFMIIPFMAVIVLLSSYFSSMISSHLMKFEKLIQRFNNQDECIDINLIPFKESYIYEFSSIESFMGDSFNLHRRNMQIQKELNDVTSQVAHDIRSPLTTLQLLLSSNKKTSPGSNDRMIDACLKQIHGIADDLLSGRRGILNRFNASKGELANELNWAQELAILIEQKRVEHQDKMVEISLKVDSNLDDLVFRFNFSDFKRIISNIVNNAVEAITGVGYVFLNCSRSEKFISVEISDTGVGFPQEILDSLNGSIKSTKSEGNALGLAHAISTIESWGGFCEIKSTPGRGSIFKILIPSLDTLS